MEASAVRWTGAERNSRMKRSDSGPFGVSGPRIASGPSGDAGADGTPSTPTGRRRNDDTRQPVASFVKSSSVLAWGREGRHDGGAG